MSEKLLPCPFCGGEAHFAVSSDGYAVECDGELCLNNALQEHPSEEYAALWWNTRVQQTCHYEFLSNIVIGSISLNACGLRCSSCGREQMSLEPPNYCPDCGKKVV